ncbi:MAG: hypothetical protein JST00_06305 [Deltaproteobacteria bacterium]|nr:hypothetical protein [Deltaproteobacteria bacterium]
MPLLRALTRVAAEAFGRLRDGEVDAARARAIEALTRDPDGAVRVPREAYASVPTREARVALLREASDRAERVVLVVPVVDAKTHLGRVAFDGPRVVLRALGIPAREPGDRLEHGAFVHCFFDEEALRSEIAEAGLVVAARRGSTFVLERGAPPPEEPDDFARELARATRLVWLADETRRTTSPERAIERMRERGRREIARGPIGRARLRRAIGWVDALVPGGENCYRRVLLELALDAGAARETVVLGLDVGRTGHIAFEGREDMPFDVAFEIPAEGRSGP